MIAKNYLNQHQGYLGEKPVSRTFDVMVIDGVARRIHNCIVHEFVVCDVDDPVLYAAHPMYEWEKSEQGTWVMKHAVESPVWHRMQDTSQMSYKFAITAKLIDKDYTFWTLKWGTKK